MCTPGIILIQNNVSYRICDGRRQGNRFYRQRTNSLTYRHLDLQMLSLETKSYIETVFREFWSRSSSRSQVLNRKCTLLVGSSDVKFHEIFCLEIFHEIFHEIFQKFHDVFFRLYTHRFNTYFLYVKHYLSFIYAYCSLSLSAGLLAWFACLSTGNKQGCRVITMTCVVHGSE